MKVPRKKMKKNLKKLKFSKKAQREGSKQISGLIKKSLKAVKRRRMRMRLRLRSHSSPKNKP
jgi:hypothetical protein